MIDLDFNFFFIFYGMRTFNLKFLSHSKKGFVTTTYKLVINKATHYVTDYQLKNFINFLLMKISELLLLFIYFNHFHIMAVKRLRKSAWKIYHNARILNFKIFGLVRLNKNCFKFF